MLCCDLAAMVVDQMQSTAGWRGLLLRKFTAFTVTIDYAMNFTKVPLSKVHDQKSFYHDGNSFFRPFHIQ